MRHSTARFALAALLGALATPAPAADVAPAGEKLAAALDAMHVEDLWLAHNRVSWKTGEPIGDAPSDGRTHTHCSAFVAAFCLRQDVYILRPPEHSSTLLANAQFDWLDGEGRDKGWRPVASALDAQHLANRGVLVVAAYKERDPKKPGHIAIVRPSAKSEAAVAREGPQVAQAGVTNSADTTLKEGFRHHPAAFRDGLVRYWAHDLTAR